MKTEILEVLIDSLIKHDEHSHEDNVKPNKTLLIGNPDANLIEKFIVHSQVVHRDKQNVCIKVEKRYLFINDSVLLRRHTVKALYMAILDQFFLAYDYSDNLAILKKGISYRIKRLHVKILIINDFHRLLKGSDFKTKRILFAINQLASDLNLSIIGIGNQESLQYLNSNTPCEFDVVELSSD